MKQYKLIETKKANAEKVMNDMAKEGWEVVSVTLDNWSHLSLHLLIIFSKDE